MPVDNFRKRDPILSDESVSGSSKKFNDRIILQIIDIIRELLSCFS